MPFPFEAQQLLEWAGQFEAWLESFANQYGYFGIFIASLIGSASIIFPIPYTILIFTFGSILDPLFVAVAGGLGSALGEFLGYFLGYYGRAIVSKERQRKMNNILRIFSRYGAITIFIFALTPLPDDLLFIPLGIMHYSLVKAFVPALLGKSLMCLILAYSGRFSNDLIKSFLGEGGSLYTTIASVILLAIILVIMFKVDWEKVFPLEEKKAQKRRSLREMLRGLLARKKSA